MVFTCVARCVCRPPRPLHPRSTPLRCAPPWSHRLACNTGVGIRLEGVHDTPIGCSGAEVLVRIHACTHWRVAYLERVTCLGDAERGAPGRETASGRKRSRRVVDARGCSLDADPHCVRPEALINPGNEEGCTLLASEGTSGTGQHLVPTPNPPFRRVLRPTTRHSLPLGHFGRHARRAAPPERCCGAFRNVVLPLTGCRQGAVPAAVTLFHRGSVALTS
jgi:hypothetical protein